MHSKNLEKTLNNFAKSVEVKAKTILKNKDKNTSGSLSKSIKHKLKVNKNSFELTFPLADYWEFVDYGVKGAGGTKANGTKWNLKKVTNNKFKYTNKRPPSKVFNSWVIKRGLAPRNSTGQFTSRKGLMIAIANSVYHTGLETTNFFSKPFESEFKSLPNKVISAYGLDLDNFLKFSLKD